MKNLLIIFCLGIVLSACKKQDSKPVEPPELVVTISSFTPATGTVGTTVTINGFNFGTDANAVKVKFGTSVLLIPKTIANDKITVDVPADATTGKILVLKGSQTISSGPNFAVVQ